MFKSILPSKRIPSADFTMVTNLADNGKENQPSSGVTQQLTAGNKNTTRTALTASKGYGHLTDKKKRNEPKKSVEQPAASPVEMNQAFDKLLDDLQIPSSLRPKLAGMDSTVKAAMLKSSHILAVQPTPPQPTPMPTTPRSQLRRARSIETLDTPRLANLMSEYEQIEPPNTSIFTGAGGHVSAHHSPYGVGGSSTPRKSSAHTRGISFDAPGFFSRSQVNLPMSASTVDLLSTKNGKDKNASLKISPTKVLSILSSTSSTQLVVEDLKKLRLLLRNESANWSQEFLKLGGYSALLTRLNEILEVEWREEQHDDQVLHELLRCLKALSTSLIGCFALRSSCPTPFVQLVALLYSDKKPGDIATRQIIVDLLLILFDLYPASSLPSSGGYPNGRSRLHREAWESDDSIATSRLITLPAPHKTVYSLIRALLLTPAPPPSESPATPISPHAFIESLHRPRIYKTYLQELSDVCRDYFWVFCHQNNAIWVLSETDESKVEKPRAPGGMTGGVEFEAMGYFTTHLRLINAIAKCVAELNMPKEHELSAFRFHSDLFLSGLERIILISRKASLTYYPTLHLELARYISHAIKSGYDLPYTVSRLIGIPPPALSKNGGTSGNTSIRTLVTPTKRGGTPALPSPKKLEPLRFE